MRERDDDPGTSATTMTMMTATTTTQWRTARAYIILKFIDDWARLQQTNRVRSVSEFPISFCFPLFYHLLKALTLHKRIDSTKKNVRRKQAQQPRLYIRYTYVRAIYYRNTRVLLYIYIYIYSICGRVRRKMRGRPFLKYIIWTYSAQ